MAAPGLQNERKFRNEVQAAHKSWFRASDKSVVVYCGASQLSPEQRRPRLPPGTWMQISEAGMEEEVHESLYSLVVYYGCVVRVENEKLEEWDNLFVPLLSRWFTWGSTGAV